VDVVVFGGLRRASRDGVPAEVLDEELAMDGALPDIEWRALPEGTGKDFFDAASGPLARISMGRVDAPRVVLVPGVTGSKEDFLLMLPLLAAAGFRVESYDLAGQYESAAAGPERLGRSQYDHALFVADLLAVLESGRTPAHVLGYSFAGTVAQLAALDRPELFASLTFLSAPPLTGQAFRGVKRIGRFSNMTPPRAGASLLLWGVRNNLNRVPPRRIAFVRERFASTRRESVNDIIGLMMRTPDRRADTRALDIPKLVAVGAHDLWPLEQHDAFARDIDAQLAVYPTGHSPCETAPHQLTRDLRKLFASSPESPAQLP
jgi:pimeloyl-ACP methyl ester carboxylesterase